MLNSLSTAYMVGRATWNAFKVNSQDRLEISNKPYRVGDWEPDTGNSSKEELMMKASNINVLDENGNRVGYFFDAFLKESHTGSVRITEHPVQSGANISDHAYNLPDRLTIEIFVSDVMDAVISGQFNDAETKSLSAYKVLRKLKEDRQPLSIRTRLHYYENMLIENMTSNDDMNTSASLKCQVAFRQIMTAVISEEIVSAKPYVDVSTNKGKVSATTPSIDQSVLVTIKEQLESLLRN